MAEQRVVTKSLAGKEDLLFGRGSATQSRGGNQYVINALSVPWVASSEAALNDLDPSQFPFVIVSTGSAITLYEYTGSVYSPVQLTNIRAKRAAAFRLVTPAVSPIITIGVPTRVEGSTAMDADSEEFSHASGRLTYEGPADLFKVDVNLVVSSANQDELEFSLALNSGVLTSTTVTLPASASAIPRSISFSALLNLSSSNQLEVFVANATSTADVEVSHYNMVVAAQ